VTTRLSIADLLTELPNGQREIDGEKSVTVHADAK